VKGKNTAFFDVTIDITTEGCYSADVTIVVTTEI
jgi:hypothetical protein